MGQLEKLLVFAVASRVILAFAAGVESEFNEIEPCEDLVDLLTGCGDTFSSITTSLLLGTIPGPDVPLLALANAILVVVVPGLTILAIVKLARGVTDS